MPARQEVFGFEREQALTLQKMATSYNGGTWGRPGSRSGTGFSGGMAVGAWMMEVDTGGITAASGATVGSGTAKILHKSSGDLVAYQPGSADVTATVYNPLEVALDAGDVFMGVRTLDGALWVVNVFNDTGLIKPLADFSLGSAMTTSDASKSATIQNQYGPGKDNSTSITVYNMATSTGGTYVFEGASGARGLALWDSGTNYRIIQMECP